MKKNYNIPATEVLYITAMNSLCDVSKFADVTLGGGSSTDDPINSL